MGDVNPIAPQNPFEHVRELCQRIRDEVAHRVVGQDEAVDCLTAALLLGGNVLMEGVPGIGKTLLARTLADVVDLRFTRIQFTPDLMPADILGTCMVSIDAHGRPTMTLQRGPLFSNVVLADEINRASPKTQSALLEAMQERQITLGTETHALAPPYLVIATQNPLDNEGTYPLPEAQLDRFMMKLLIRFPTEDEVLDIVFRTEGSDDTPIRRVANAESILSAGRAIRLMPIADLISKYAVRVVFATHPEAKTAPSVIRQYVHCGASPRAAQAVMAVAKFFAVLDGRLNVATEDVQRAALPCLRHRLLLNFDGIAHRAAPDDLVMQVLKEVESPSN